MSEVGGRNLMNRMKVPKRKFIRNILIGLVGLIVVSQILDIAPGYRRNSFGQEVNLIMNGRNLTETLAHSLYVNEEGVIFISMEDAGDLFDERSYRLFASRDYCGRGRGIYTDIGKWHSI